MFDVNHPDTRTLQPGISVHMMVKNPPLDRTAALVTFLLPHVQEVVIVDTGSDLVTLDAMSKWNYPNTAPVSLINAEFVDFSTTRNIGLAAHRFEWTLGIDPDELPSWYMLEHMVRVTREGDKNYPSARAWCYWTYNWWGGILGPEMDYHWHTRLWKTKGSYLYRPIHELVMVQGKSELSMRNSAELPYAPKQAYLIHSKSTEEITKADQFYSKIGEVSR